MENSLVKDIIIDNRFAIEANKALKIIKSFVKKKIPILLITNAQVYDKFDFEINLDSKQFKIYINSERGSLGFRLFVNEIFFSLKNYDKRLLNLFTCNKENLVFFLEILKEFIDKKLNENLK